MGGVLVMVGESAAGNPHAHRQAQRTAAGSATNRGQASTMEAMSRPISLIGAPTDVGASVRGAGMGPDALRVAGLLEALRACKLEVVDRGNLAGPPNPWQPAANGTR